MIKEKLQKSNQEKGELELRCVTAKRERLEFKKKAEVFKKKVEGLEVQLAAINEKLKSTQAQLAATQQSLRPQQSTAPSPNMGGSQGSSEQAQDTGSSSSSIAAPLGGNASKSAQSTPTASTTPQTNIDQEDVWRRQLHEEEVRRFLWIWIRS